MFVFILKFSELGCDRDQDDTVCRRRLSIFLDQGNINKRRRPQIRSGRGWFLSVLCVLIIPGAVCSEQCAVCSVQCAMFSVQYREIVQSTKGAEQIGQGKLGQAWHDKAG